MIMAQRTQFNNLPFNEGCTLTGSHPQVDLITGVKSDFEKYSLSAGLGLSIQVQIYLIRNCDLAAYFISYS